MKNFTRFAMFITVCEKGSYLFNVRRKRPWSAMSSEVRKMVVSFYLSNIQFSGHYIANLKNKIAPCS